ncbi:MAG: hypothetical protein J6U13_08095 [Salinivirgaceae bacterium]|nr:hypothetical protein [Salinivirgaceae bacterium]
MTLVAPLDWGLGHATRCVPIINECLAKGEKVIIAADGAAAAFLKSEFPNLTHIRLKGWRMRYFWPLPLAIFLQLPLFGVSILLEHSRLKRLMKQYNISRIVSDNRYGLWSRNADCTIITHQLYIQLPRWLKPFERPLHAFTARLLRRFSHIWVPDYADAEKSLSGALSHGGALDSEVEYIGPQSRFTDDCMNEPALPVPNVLVVLSGPGRQKQRFAKLILKHLKGTTKRILVVGAEPNLKYQVTDVNTLIVNHLPTRELNSLLLLSPHVIARSGYTTIMDLHRLGRHAILFPTKGQWEQEYLQEWIEKKSNNMTENTSR